MAETTWTNAGRPAELSAAEGLHGYGAESPRGRIGRNLLTLLLCAHFTLAYMAEHLFLPLRSYAAGTAMTPYQYRVLPMLFMRGLVHVHGFESIAQHLPVGDHSVPWLTMALLAFAGMWIAVYATGATIERLTGGHLAGPGGAARWMALLVVWMSYFNLASTWGLNYTVPYDVPSLGLFAVGLYLIVSGRIAWLYVLFPLATLDRETSCFLLVFYVVWSAVRRRDGDRSIRPAIVGLHVLLLGAMWLGIKVVLARMFAGNPAEGGGGVFAHHLLQNFRFLAEPQQWPVLLSVCGFAVPLVLAQWRAIRDRAYQWALGSVLALWFAGMMVVGVVVEIRIFAEWAALLTPAVALIFFHRFRPASEVKPSLPSRPGAALL